MYVLENVLTDQADMARAACVVSSQCLCEKLFKNIKLSCLSVIFYAINSFGLLQFSEQKNAKMPMKKLHYKQYLFERLYPNL